MKSKQIFGLLLLGLAWVLPVQSVTADEEIMVLLRPAPGAMPASKPKEIVVVGSKAYEVGEKGARTLLPDGRYPTADNRMIIIVGEKVSPESTGLATGKRMHKPFSSALEQKGLNPQPLPPKTGTMGNAGNANAGNAGNARMLNPQPLPPKSASEVSELSSMKLQKNMDKKSKATETTSSVMKKQSDTQSGIIQNLK